MAKDKTGSEDNLVAGVGASEELLAGHPYGNTPFVAGADVTDEVSDHPPEVNDHPSSVNLVAGHPSEDEYSGRGGSYLIDDATQTRRPNK